MDSTSADCLGLLKIKNIQRQRRVTKATGLGQLQPRSQGLSSLPPLSLRKTLVDSGHVALVDKHFPTRVVFSLYFDSATGRKSIRLTRHFLNK